ncbi:MAG: aromatic ring-hydroxylating dioxygenase subunit alpha [Deltaproteobacteria bacterium]|nr:aromatic ring-hydroxylating dioxygenase subunit alpha [Myxococcales bacterium]MDP3221406.1 aromatic ring-hydroxylating dioxygenase subunit alpha [Deltaproteobacteria bacterium]
MDENDEASRAKLPAGVVPLKNLTRGQASVAKVLQAWYIVARSHELTDNALAATVWDIPLVLFRGAGGQPAALLDRCPHRNVPLSLGQVAGAELQCGYHGWRFGADGGCRFIPSRPTGDADGPARKVPSFATRELDGFIWVYATPDVTPTVEPYRFALMGAPGYDHVVSLVTAESTLHAATENALDVPHTAFLHKGLFRGDSRGVTITAVVRRSGDRVEAQYLGESRPPGLVARLLSPSGGEVTHYDRFILPSIAEVEYRMGDENHLLVATAMTPVSDFVTRLWAVVSFRLRVPHTLVKRALKPLAMQIFQQDAVMLKAQTALVKRFGGEQFASTEIDVLGRHIWRLLRAAERGDAPGAEVLEERVELVV